MSRQAQPKYHVFVDYAPMDNQNIPGILVPQEIYSAPKAYQRRPSIKFAVGGQPGVKLQDALNGNLTKLRDGSRIPDLTGANRISCRILWPGYAPWADTPHVLDATDMPCNVAKLAKIIAKAVKRFYDDYKDVESTEASWHLNGVPFGDLVLLELHHVSEGSWQPVLSLVW